MFCRFKRRTADSLKSIITVSGIVAVLRGLGTKIPVPMKNASTELADLKHAQSQEDPSDGSALNHAVQNSATAVPDVETEQPGVEQDAEQLAPAQAGSSSGAEIPPVRAGKRKREGN